MEPENRRATQVLTEGEKPAARGRERALRATASHPQSESPTRLAGWASLENAEVHSLKQVQPTRERVHIQAAIAVWSAEIKTKPPAKNVRDPHHADGPPAI